MGVIFNGQEGCALYDLLSENTSDIILKTDSKGFILHASPAIELLGVLLPNMLIGPHLADLFDPSYAMEVRAEHDSAIAGRRNASWVQFPAFTPENHQWWFEIQVRPLTDSCGRTYGALSAMRSIEEMRSLEERLFTVAMTDPLTGLTNRQAFISMLQHLLDDRIDGCLAVFDIDYFRAINMRYGQFVGDEVLIVFADLVKSMTRSTDIISRIGGESLGILLPGTTPPQAKAICQHIIDTLSEISRATGHDNIPITASAGIARIGVSVDDTIKRSELALFLAKAKGRNRLEIERGSHLGDWPDCSHTQSRPREDLSSIAELMPLPGQFTLRDLTG
jgi:diguanylate cyclase (GGDEF)-like protein/PAS domain S-box-containing protein